MVEVALTKLSSKGQIVIPSNLRKDFNIGEQLLIMRKNNDIILYRVNNLDKKFKDELRFFRKTEHALKQYENGKFKEKRAKDFLKELEKW